METIKTDFRYTREEYVKAERQYLFASKLMTRTSVVVALLYLPFSIFLLFLFSFSLLSIVAVVIAVFCISMGCLLYFYIPGYKFRQTAKYQEEYSITFSREGMLFITPTIHSELKWDAYSAVWESGDFYFLVQAPRIYSIIPKRVFRDDGERQVFEEFAVSGMGCEKRVV